MTMYEKLQAAAKKESIIAGVGRAEPFSELKKRLDSVRVPFVKESIETRTEPSLTMPTVKSLVAIGVPYNVDYEEVKDEKYRGVISVGAVGEDYHRIVMRKLEKIRDELLYNSNVMMFSDTGPLADREVALRCGLGALGKNLSVINDTIGGMFFIGYMLTDVEFEKWEAPPVNKSVDLCKDCGKCIAACPGKAFENGKFSYEKCVSYITQKKGVLGREECFALGRQIYGCDVCQRVCPYNKNTIKGFNEYAYPDIEKLLNMSGREFDRIFKPTAAGWRGRRTLQRNAIIALGNMRARAMRSVIEKFVEDSREDISSAAKYALERLREN